MGILKGYLIYLSLYKLRIVMNTINLELDVCCHPMLTSKSNCLHNYFLLHVTLLNTPK